LQIAGGIVGLLGSGAAVLAVGTALLILEPVIVAIVVAGSIPSLITNRLSSRLYHGYTVRQIAGDRRRAYLYEVMCRKDEAHEIRAFDSSDHLRKEHDRLYEAKVADLRGVLRRRMVYGTVNALATTLITVGSLVLLLHFVRIGRIPFTDAAVALGGLLLVAGRLRGLVASSGSLYEGALFLQDFTDFIDAGRELTSIPSELPEPSEPSEPFETLEMDRVSFTYPSRTEPSLNEVSLRLDRGEVIALVGENGSGKTTLAKLLAGLYEPTAGIMRRDGQDVREFDLADLRAHCTVIFQDFARYFVTAHENIAISRIERMGDRQAAREAAALAGAGGFLAALPQGYDTLLGPSFVGGSDLSLGQWQRIALARAYFRDSPLLILDEPTASLDPRGEYEIFQQVRRLAGDRTVVLISHRFSSVRAADRILVLRSGRIVEEGSHDTLMSRRGLYHELFTLQAEGYQPRPV
jgi:ATP-binding cassette, subfamily B, bacterial